eukprot:8653321-Ditylum_brightwellii.AAC.1
MEKSCHLFQPSKRHTIYMPPTQQYGQVWRDGNGKRILIGKLNIDALDVGLYTKEFLHEPTRKDNNPPEIDTTITTQNLKDNYKIGQHKQAVPPYADI